VFVRKGYVDILIPVLNLFLILTYLSEVSLPSEKPDAVVCIFKKGNCVLANNYSPISILNTSSKIFEFVVRECFTLCKSKFDLCQHGVNKSEFNTAICLSYLDFIPLLVYSQGQVYGISFDWRIISGLVLHYVLL
jgi:hypothetical protein